MSILTTGITPSRRHMSYHEELLQKGLTPIEEYSNDVTGLFSGVIGAYAIPGNEEPSAYFIVKKITIQNVITSVVYLERTDVGHELHDQQLDSDVFLVLKQIVRERKIFRSRLTDSRSARTQENIFYYLNKIRILRTGSNPGNQMSLAHQLTFENEFKKASSDVVGLINGVLGNYAFTTENNGAVIFNVFSETDLKTRIRVAFSNVKNLPVSNVFLPVHLLFVDTVQKITPDSVHERQVAIHSFIRKKLKQLAGL